MTKREKEEEKEIKSISRSAIKILYRENKIKIRLSCQVPGCDAIKTDFYIPDYYKPFNIYHLCRRHITKVKFNVISLADTEPHDYSDQVVDYYGEKIILRLKEAKDKYI